METGSQDYDYPGFNAQNYTTPSVVTMDLGVLPHFGDLEKALSLPTLKLCEKEHGM